jgi:hypothetical protein
MGVEERQETLPGVHLALGRAGGELVLATGGEGDAALFSELR